MKTSEAEIADLIELYHDDLPSAPVAKFEYVCWQRKWKETTNPIPETLGDALLNCDKDMYPNLHILLRIGCTIPVSSAENERTNSVLKGLKTYLRSTMSNDRLTGLALMKIHRNMSVNNSDVVNTFAAKQPRRMLLSTLFE